MRYFYKLNDDCINEDSIPIFPYTSIASDLTPSQLRARYVQEQSYDTQEHSVNATRTTRQDTSTTIDNNECFQGIGLQDGSGCGDYMNCLQTFNTIPYPRVIENVPVPLQIAYPENLLEYDEF